MARLPYLDKGDLAPENQDLLARNINLIRMMAHSPEAARAFGKLGGFIRFGSKLDPRLRELAILQVGYSTRADYEYSHHIKLGLEFGVSESDVRAIAEETAGRTTDLDAPAKAVLKAAREMTTALAISDDTFAALQGFLSPELIVDLVTTISFYNGVVRLLASLQIDVEDDYQTYLTRFPYQD